MGIFPMKGLTLAFALILGLASTAWSATPAPLTGLHAIHLLSNAQASQSLPVAFEATVIYFRKYEKTMFVQDGDVAIYVQATTNARLVPGDRVLIKGTTQPSFRPFVLSSDLTLLRHDALPKPEPASFDELIRAKHDCMLVSVRARVRAADMVMSSDVRSINLQMLADGGTIDAVVDTDDASALESLLDADVEVSGAASGRFDGKMQQTGVLLHVTSLADIKVINRAGTHPQNLPVTPMDQILGGYHVEIQSQRIRVHGTITYYQPGSAVVLQDGTKSLWIQTHTIAPIQLGSQADATGFPGLHDGFLTLTNGAIQDSHVQAPVTPSPATWRQLALSGNVFDLVSIEGQVVTEVREASQDEYVLTSDGQVFSAIFRHPPPAALVPDPPPPMRDIPIGTRIRVTGICILEDSNPFNAQVPFSILMRSPDDIAIVAKPSMLNVGNLIRVVSVLLLGILAIGSWGWTMKRKVSLQTAEMAARIEAEAHMERRMAQLELKRSRILEDISGSRPLAEIVEQITQMVSFRLNGAPSWCEIAGGARLGHHPADANGMRIARMEIRGRSGAELGVLFTGLDPQTQQTPGEWEALSVGTKLAALAIETRRLYSDLLHRSQFDQLTDIHNRFSLDSQLESLIEGARERGGIFGLIYIDLDDFKQVNDLYGHRTGDLYLQEVAERMKRQLRSGDVLARLGGDEFAALMPLVGSRADAEEIAGRLEHSFDEPFAVEGYVLSGSASVGVALYPEDGSTKDGLLSAADAAMYVAKHTRHPMTTRHGAGPVRGFPSGKGA
jgi:diguanylate cyclase (GGDEF)-like protein